MGWDFWVSLLRFLWWRDTASAFCLILWLELYLDTADVHLAGSYFRASHELRQEQEQRLGSPDEACPELGEGRRNLGDDAP